MESFTPYPFHYKEWFSHQNFSPIDTMLKQLPEMKLFEGVVQNENLDNPNSVSYLKMNVNEFYGRVKAGELCSIHANKSK